MSQSNLERGARHARRDHGRGRFPESDVLYRSGRRDHAVLDAEQEASRTRAILDAEARLCHAIARATGGREAMRTLGRDLSSGRVDLRAILLNPESDPSALARDGARLSGALAEGDGAIVAEIRVEPSVLSDLARHARCPEVTEAARALARAKQDLVLPNLRLVMMFAHKHRTRGAPLADLVQEGNLGLMRAVDKYDPRRGVRFGTYAAFWIRQALQRAVTPHVRLPAYVADDRRRVQRARSRHASEHAREPTAIEIAQVTRLPLGRVNAVLSLSAAPASLDAPVGEDGSATLGDFVAGSTIAADEAVSAAELRVRLARALALLSPREKTILELRFGIGAATREHTLEEVGRSLSLTRERVRQIERAALDKLRASAHGPDLASHIHA